jgi:hypothetical protein
MNMHEQAIVWSGPGLTRVPFDVYTDAPLAREEQEKIFRGDTWNYLCLDAELPEPGSYRTTFVGETPVVVVRDEPLRSPRRVDRAGEVRQGRRLSVRVPRLELQPPGRPHRRCI